MANVSTGILGDANRFNLKEISLGQVRQEVSMFLVNGEQVIQAFQTVRDQVLFTNKRIIVVNVQGITGKKTSYFSYPYSKVQFFGVETAGVLDIDIELTLAYANGAQLQFDFKSRVDIKQICSTISSFVI
ncbi:MAG: PH domain-containing protein [Lactimicrobium sp.]|jgi:hypothetical protein|uniref:PH domain-containing protein n=1 Tax=Lactimicrobium sp. TaxID=2563780 RepID=UPI002F354CD5